MRGAFLSPAHALATNRADAPADPYWDRRRIFADAESARREFPTAAGVDADEHHYSQGLRTAFPEFGGRIPNSLAFAWAMGIWAGVSTMVANAAGPIMAIYFIALALPKENLIGTSAWLFLIINVFKLPFSAALGLLHAPSLLLDLSLTPLVLLGNIMGKTLVRRIPQRAFETLLLISATAAALKLIL